MVYHSFSLKFSVLFSPFSNCLCVCSNSLYAQVSCTVFFFLCQCGEILLSCHQVNCFLCSFQFSDEPIQISWFCYYKFSNSIGFHFLVLFFSPEFFHLFTYTACLFHSTLNVFPTLKIKFPVWPFSCIWALLVRFFRYFKLLAMC